MPGSAGPLTIFFLTTFFAVFSLDWALRMANSAIFSAISVCWLSQRLKESFTTPETNEAHSLEESLSLVCPENCGSRIFIDRTYAILCHTSSGVSLIFLGIRFLNSQNSLRASVSPDLSPLTCVPPPTVGIKFTKLSAVVLLVFSVQVSAQLSSSSLFFNAITKGIVGIHSSPSNEA